MSNTLSTIFHWLAWKRACTRLMVLAGSTEKDARESDWWQLAEVFTYGVDPLEACETSPHNPLSDPNLKPEIDVILKDYERESDSVPPTYASSLLSNPVAYRLTFDPNLRVVEDQFGEWMIERMGTYLRRYRARHIPDWTDDPIHAELHPTPEAAAQAAKAFHDKQQEGK